MNEEQNNLEVRRIRRMLKQMYSLAEHASLTGALSDGAEDAVAAYNRILQRLAELQDTPLVLFAPLPLDASFDRLGVASRLLEGYVSDEEADRSNGGPKINFGYNTANINGLEDIKDLGRIIRDNLPDFMRHRFEPPAPPAPPHPPFQPDPPTEPAPPRPHFSERGQGSEFD